VLLCGYYGEHNLGDDALLEALLSLLPPGVTAVVTAHDQRAVAQRHAVSTVQRRSLGQVLRALDSCRALVMGGGSLLQDSTSFRSLIYYAVLIVSARLRRKPVLLWAQGLGPLRRRRSRLLVRLLLPLATAISWRDSASARLGRELGVAAPHGSDAVWALPMQSWQGAGGPIVVCWRPTPLLKGDAWRPYLAALELLAERHDRPVVWLPFHGHQDAGLLDTLQQQGLVGEALQRRSRCQQVATPAEAMELFRGAGLVVAMRLHALILAALSGSPVSALSYDPKVRACATEFGCSCLDLHECAPAPSDLCSLWSDALDQPPSRASLLEMQAATAVHQQCLQPLLN
jgi:polysaccharide pyruvyl transferase CsaB